MPACACATTRSAAAICSSSARSSGSNAFSRASQLVTATSLSCNASSASRSGCTLPPCVLENLPARTLGISFIRYRSLFKGQAGFVRLRGEIDFLLLARDFPIEPSRLQPIHRTLEGHVGLLVAEPLCL